MKLKSRNNYQWIWHWWCVSINLFYDYKKHIKIFRKGSSWIIDSVIDHTNSISKYNPLAGSIYIKLPKELDYPRKGLINIKYINGNECFKLCLVRYLNPADVHPGRITKADKDFG